MSSESFLLLVRLGFSLSLVFGLMWVAAKVVRGKGGALKRTSGERLEVIERKPLSRNSSIAIVRVGNETLAVGITENSVSLLGPADVPDLDLPVVEQSAEQSAAPTNGRLHDVAVDLRADRTAEPEGRGRNLIDTLRDMTVRHVPG